MPDPDQLLVQIQAIAGARGAYRPEAYVFLLEALETAYEIKGRRGHVTGEVLLEGVRRLGRDRFGPLAKDVFNAWGVESTLDFGHIVFHLVEAGVLQKTPRDSLADFVDRFDFHEAFEAGYFGGSS